MSKFRGFCILAICMLLATSAFAQEQKLGVGTLAEQASVPKSPNIRRYIYERNSAFVIKNLDELSSKTSQIGSITLAIGDSNPIENLTLILKVVTVAPAKNFPLKRQAELQIEVESIRIEDRLVPFRATIAKVEQENIEVKDGVVIIAKKQGDNSSGLSKVIKAPIAFGKFIARRFFRSEKDIILKPGTLIMVKTTDGGYLDIPLQNLNISRR